MITKTLFLFFLGGPLNTHIGDRTRLYTSGVIDDAKLKYLDETKHKGHFKAYDQAYKSKLP